MILKCLRKKYQGSPYYNDEDYFGLPQGVGGRFSEFLCMHAHFLNLKKASAVPAYRASLENGGDADSAIERVFIKDANRAVSEDCQ